MMRQFICLFKLIYTLWESPLQYLNFFTRKNVNALEANIDDVAFQFHIINFPFFENPPTKF